MTETSSAVFDAGIDEPLIGVPIEVNGKPIVRYFTDEAAADKALGPRKRGSVRHLAGVWKDLDWQAAVEELDRIRHESRPTSPIDLEL